MASKRTRSNPIKVIDKLDPRVKTKEYRARLVDYDFERQVATVTAPNYVSSTEDSFKNTKHNFRLILGHGEDFSNMRDIMDFDCITLTDFYAHPDRVMRTEVRKPKFTSDMSMEDIRMHEDFKFGGGHELAKELRRRGEHDHYVRSQAISIPKPVTLLHMMWETIFQNNYGRAPHLPYSSYLNFPLTTLFSLIRDHLDPEYADAIYKLLNAIKGLEGSMDGLQGSIANLVSGFTGTHKLVAEYLNNAINSFMVRKGYSAGRDQAIIDALALCELTKDDRPILLNSKQIDNESFARICSTYGHRLTDKQLQSIREDVYEYSRDLADRYNTLLRAAYNMLIPCIYGSVIPVLSEYKIIAVNSEIIFENTRQVSPRI